MVRLEHRQDKLAPLEATIFSVVVMEEAAGQDTMMLTQVVA